MVVEPNQLRLQVFLSRQGICSRRKAFALICEGRVKVNGQIVREPSTLVNFSTDKVEADGKAVAKKSYSYILLNKPKGYVTTKKDRFAFKTVFDLLPEEFQHLVPVGRLDKDTEGLLLLTNDGNLVYRLTHPKFNIEKTYLVILKGILARGAIRDLEQGILLGGRKTAEAKIKDVRCRENETECLITIHEGRKRQIRLMFAEKKYPVVYLKRIAQGPLNLGNLGAGQWRKLTKEEIRDLKDLKNF